MPVNRSPMTENLAVTALQTPLASQLAAIAHAPRMSEFRGVLTPFEFDVPAKEIEVLARGAAAHDLGWMRRVSVRGEDRFRWLSGMVTNTVNDLASNGGLYVLDRIQGDLLNVGSIPPETDPVGPPSRSGWTSSCV